MMRTIRTTLLGLAAAAALAPAAALACGDPALLLPLEQYVIYPEQLDCEVGPCPEYGAFDVGNNQATYIHAVDLSGLGLSELELQRVQKEVLNGRVIVAGEFVYEGNIGTLVVSALVGETWG